MKLATIHYKCIIIFIFNTSLEKLDRDFTCIFNKIRRKFKGTLQKIPYSLKRVKHRGVLLCWKEKVQQCLSKQTGKSWIEKWKMEVALDYDEWNVTNSIACETVECSN